MANEQRHNIVNDSSHWLWRIKSVPFHSFLFVCLFSLSTNMLVSLPTQLYALTFTLSLGLHQGKATSLRLPNITNILWECNVYNKLDTKQESHMAKVEARRP